MKTLSKFFSISILFTNLFLLQLVADEVLVTLSQGDHFIIDVEPTTPFLEVMSQIKSYLVDPQTDPEDNLAQSEEAFEISFSSSSGVPGFIARKSKQRQQRNYGAMVSPSEKENIRFIIRSLAKHNWSQLAKEESSLKKAGDKINHIHPLRFLQCVFTDEELKVGLFVIRNKSLVWSQYYDGLKKSLNDESDLNNLLQFAPDFANNIGVNLNVVMPYVQTRQWSGLIDVLINSIPRQGNPDRYDM